MPMTIRERLMATLRRGAADRIPETIYRYTMELLRTGAPGGRLVIGCTEDYPASEFAKTFNTIGRAMADYEGYAWE